VVESVPYDVKFQYDTYYMPWTRISGYMVGMMTGYVLFRWRGKIKMHKVRTKRTLINFVFSKWIGCSLR